jgi:hypothetical protein
MAGSPRTSECGISEKRTSGQETEVNAMEDGEINDEAGEEEVLEDMGYAKLKNKVMISKKRVVGETGPEFSSE